MTKAPRPPSACFVTLNMGVNISQRRKREGKNWSAQLKRSHPSGDELYLPLMTDTSKNNDETFMTNDVIIETRDLSKDYIDGGNIIQALKPTSITVSRGEMVAIMGPSGSGKSTLLYVLGLLQPPTSGQYIFKGQDILKYSREEQAHFRNLQLGFVFQSCDLLANSTVFENLELPLIYAETDRNLRRKKIMEALDRVGLSHRVDHWANRLSGGERQRAAIARALVNNPSLILGDEPTGQLDQKNTGIVVEQLRDIVGQGFTVVLVTHEDEIGQACDRIIRIRDGVMVSDGREDFLNHSDTGNGDQEASQQQQ